MTNTPSQTPYHHLPLLAPAQAAKHIIVNEALSRLDARLHIHVQSMSQVAPPPAPNHSDRFIVPLGAQGDWSELQVGALVSVGPDDQWSETWPDAGWIVWVHDSQQLIIWSGTD